MSITLHTLGLPRIGKNRELKFALESYWKGKTGPQELEHQAAVIRGENWQTQAQTGMSMVNVGDFSLYDHVLDTSFLLGHLAPRFAQAKVNHSLDRYFGAARGLPEQHIEPGSMTKWFDTNYHYIVPEIDATTRFQARPEPLLHQIAEAQQAGYTPKVQLLGPVSYLYLSRSVDQTPVLQSLKELTAAYKTLLSAVAKAGVEWVQMDEPILVLDDLNAPWHQAFEQVYAELKGGPKLLLTTYFESVAEELELVFSLPVAGVHLDFHKNRDLIPRILDRLAPEQVLSLGVVDGRGVWREDLQELQQEISPIYQQLADRLWLAPTCSLLHLPWSISGENLPAQLDGVLGFGVEKLQDLATLGAGLDGRLDPPELKKTGKDFAVDRRRRIARQAELLTHERSPFEKRRVLQKEALGLPDLPTTTIGSFPQTGEIRGLRQALKKGELDAAGYQEAIRGIITENIRIQEEIGLDVLVHGEPERNDMVSFFAEFLDGVWSSQAGWVQSYGSRCVRPPVIYKSVQRKPDLGWKWIQFAQGLTNKPVKGMLTGPVTILKWSFVPQDVPPQELAYDIALALREEVLELEAQGISIIQIDEPAFREVLPLKKSRWPQALDWAARAFRVSHAGVADTTQVHSHMCYSDFNSIFDGIKAMDADVISIETSRSKGELFAELAAKGYTQGLGPGVYDIHSPLIPRQEEIHQRLGRALEHLDRENLWVNPDCGLKTRSWQETRPALEAMVQAARELRRA